MLHHGLALHTLVSCFIISSLVFKITFLQISLQTEDITEDYFCIKKRFIWDSISHSSLVAFDGTGKTWIWPILADSSDSVTWVGAEGITDVFSLVVGDDVASIVLFGHDSTTGNNIDWKISMDEPTVEWQFILSGVNNTLGNMFYGTALVEDNVIYTFRGFDTVVTFYYGEFNYSDGKFICKILDSL